jgi:pSer/pThr/pTyr-binding forkhead associated (FHA) protein
MPFQLTIAQGQDSGKAFLFEQPSITIGRTEECDVVLYDQGVSRQHARIFNEGPAFFVEDMGSANGTRVNGQTVQKKQLVEGDAVALGAVVFTFSQKSPPPPVTLAPPEQDADGNSADEAHNTRIVSKEEIQKKRIGVPPPTTDGIDPLPAPTQLGTRRSTMTMSAVEVDEALSRTKGPSAGRLSAVERARIRREDPGLTGTLRILWLDASDRMRQGVAAGGAVLLLGLIALTYYLALYTPDSKASRPPEPTVLGRSPIKESFGLGEGVDYKRRDSKVFDFEFNAATRALIILHYQSKDISEGEVDVAVNGKSVAKLLPDVTDPRMNELLIPPSLVKRDERNVLSFDNVHNPPHSDTWRIWDLWIEVVPLPDLGQEQLLREARDAYQRGQLAYERREVGAESRYMAWRDFREAWLKLEAYPDPKPELYRLARERMRESQVELDHTCKKLLLEATAAYEQHQYSTARNTLEYVREYFPASDQPCPRLAEEKRAEYEL